MLFEVIAERIRYSIAIQSSSGGMGFEQRSDHVPGGARFQRKALEQ